MRDVVPQHLRPPAGRGDQAEQDLQQGRLARTVGADEPGGARTDLEGQRVQGQHRTVVLGEPLDAHDGIHAANLAAASPHAAAPRRRGGASCRRGPRPDAQRGPAPLTVRALVVLRRLALRRRSDAPSDVRALAATAVAATTAVPRATLAALLALTVAGRGVALGRRRCRRRRRRRAGPAAGSGRGRVGRGGLLVTGLALGEHRGEATACRAGRSP